MTLGVGGSNDREQLEQLKELTTGIAAIAPDELRQRLSRATALMEDAGFDAIYLNAGTNLYYFTGTRWSSSERMVGALLTTHGELHYIAPAFERGTLEDYIAVPGEIHCWEEHESPYTLVGDVLSGNGIADGLIGLDESTPYFLVGGMQKANPRLRFADAVPVTAGCRMQKSAAELALLQRAKDMTVEVHKAAARILRPGISTG